MNCYKSATMKETPILITHVYKSQCTCIFTSHGTRGCIKKLTPCGYHGLDHDVWNVGCDHLDEPQILQYSLDQHPHERRQDEVMQQCLKMYTHCRFLVKTVGDSKDFSNLKNP